MLFGLSRIVNRGKLDVRTRALNTMFEIMKLYGRAFLDTVRADITLHRIALYLALLRFSSYLRQYTALCSRAVSDNIVVGRFVSYHFPAL